MKMLKDKYANPGIVHKNHLLFQTVQERDLSWDATIAGFAQNGHLLEAGNLFNASQQWHKYYNLLGSVKFGCVQREFK